MPGGGSFVSGEWRQGAAPEPGIRNHQGIRETSKTSRASGPRDQDWKSLPYRINTILYYLCGQSLIYSIIFLCPIELSFYRRTIKTHKWVTVQQLWTCPYITTNTHAVGHFPHIPTRTYKQFLEHQMFVNPQLQIVPTNALFPPVWVTFC